MQTINWKRVLRLSIVALVFLFIIFYLSLSWVFVQGLVNVTCTQETPLSSIVPQPILEKVPLQDYRELEIWHYSSRNRALIISLGGMQGSTGTRNPPVEFLLEAGYGVVQVPARTCALPPGKVTLGYQESLDANLILQTVLSNHENIQNVGVIGYSMGGAAALQFAARNPQVTAVVAEGGYGNLGRNFYNSENELFVIPLQLAMLGWYRLYTGVDPWQSDPLGVIGQISPNAVFLIYGDNEIIGPHPQDQFEAAG
ncbi:MAG: dienelactone hydrolase family protein, partial [Chloroflexota bacterium]